MMLSILSLLFVFSAFAQDENCDHIHHPELAELERLEKQLDWKAASDEDIKKAFCSRKAPFTNSEMNQWLNANKSPLKLSKKINGINFEDESPEDLESFRLLTSFVDWGGSIIPEKQKTFSSTCKKVDCAVKEIFGNDVGLQLLFMQRRYGMNGSHIIKDETQASLWKKEELDTVLLALSDFPEGLMPIQDSKTFVHANRETDNGRTLANAVITVFQLWNTQTPEQRRSTVVHELGHAIAGVTKLDDSPTWMKHSGWSTTTAIVDGESVSVAKAAKPETIISEYGQTNEWEDLAESVVAYRYNPKALKELSPDKYNLVKKLIFDNVEYTSEEACRSPEKFSDGLKTKAQQKVANWVPSAAELTQIANRCSELAVISLASTGSVAFDSVENKNCYENSVRAQSAEFMKAEAATDPDLAHLAPVLRNVKLEIPQTILNSTAEKARLNHKINFTKQLNRMGSEKLNCSPDFYKYGYQQFNKDELGMDTYTYKDDLNKIGGKVCEGKAKGTLGQTINSMLR
jgi:hypothetical protein